MQTLHGLLVEAWGQGAAPQSPTQTTLHLDVVAQTQWTCDCLQHPWRRNRCAMCPGKDMGLTICIEEHQAGMLKLQNCLEWSMLLIPTCTIGDARGRTDKK